ncbi:MAG: ammonia-forming cytochrome c nitrite reductase subunit c552 [Coriobacteriaceae bacterium]|nr:ammonia-forming cytochrome c nitrite reductase subunit c552 [Coriobacteriaceae bacterium]
MNRQKLISGAVVVFVCCALGIGIGLLGCSASKETPQAEGSETPAEQTATVKTMNQWGKEYPLQWNSYAQIKVNPYDGDKEGHFCLRTKELGPIKKDSRGYKPFRTEDENYVIDFLTYDDEAGQWIVDDSVMNVVTEATAYTKGCFSCRSSKFQEIEAREGADIYKQPLDNEFIAEINGQAWDCALCHGDNPENPADSYLKYFNEGTGTAFDEMDPGLRVCGQCHTTMNHFSEDHFRYGFEVDGLVDSKFEQGQTSFDKETGITTASGIYLPDLEMVQTSKMREMGVTCVSCHMPKTTDKESGAEYTMHNASGSPLENKAAMEYCLTCHKARGINSADEMVKMVREQQEKAATVLTALKERCADTKAKIKAAVEGATIDMAKLDAAREKYTRAYARYQVALGDPNTAGLKIAHNPAMTWQYVDEANVILTEIDALLG